MKKLLIVFFLLVSVGVFAQPSMGPAFGERHFNRSFGMIGMFYSIQPQSFSGTLEIKDGFIYVRVGERLYQLLLPKREGLTIDTVPGKGTVKLDVIGHVVVVSPFNQIYVLEMWLDGVEQLFLWQMPMLIFPDFLKS